jgi:hypothetical protein
MDSIPRDVKNIILSIIFGIIEEHDDKVVINETQGKEGDEFQQTGGPPSGEDVPEKEPEEEPPQAAAPEHQPESPDADSE